MLFVSGAAAVWIGVRDGFLRRRMSTSGGLLTGGRAMAAGALYVVSEWPGGLDLGRVLALRAEGQGDAAWAAADTMVELARQMLEAISKIINHSHE